MSEFTRSFLRKDQRYFCDYCGTQIELKYGNRSDKNIGKVLTFTIARIVGTDLLKNVVYAMVASHGVLRKSKLNELF